MKFKIKNILKIAKIWVKNVIETSIPVRFSFDYGKA